MRILIGYDGSDYSAEALGDLVRAGLPPDCEARVMAVADVWPQLPQSCLDLDEPAVQQLSLFTQRARELAVRELQGARTTASEGVMRLSSLLPGWKITAAPCAGSAAKALIEQAQKWQADLIAVGSRGRGALKRAVLGSVSHTIVLHASCSVRILRPPRRAVGGATEGVRIVLGIDGSPNSAAALNAVSLRRWPEGTEVRVVIAQDIRLATVVPSMMPDLGMPMPMDPELQEWPRQAARDAADELQRAGIRATPVVRQGDPKAILLDEAESWEADCIFLGARGVSRLEGFLLGSVASAVSARAECSVEVVRFD